MLLKSPLFPSVGCRSYEKSDYVYFDSYLFWNIVNVFKGQLSPCGKKKKQLGQEEHMVAAETMASYCRISSIADREVLLRS